MTILEAITIVLSDEPMGLTCKDITQRILEKELYHFNTTNPNSIVNHDIRRRCVGLNFPSAHPIKHFEIVCGHRGQSVYRLLRMPVSSGAMVEDKRAKDTPTEELLPIEKMQIFYEAHLKSIREQLLERILDNDPAFFESLVVDLLIKLGYGYGKGAGKVVGKSHDGGIDGIIHEDKLGLDIIYIQAKRYNHKQKVGSKEIQAFVGAMKSIKKGIFITTSSFTKAAIEYANELSEKNLSLVDGMFLSELMTKYQVGVKTIKSFSLYELDADFFDG